MRSTKLLHIAVALSAITLAQPYGRPPALRNIGLDQRLGAQVPLDTAFTDEQGHSVFLRDLLHGRPVVLSLVYYRCPMLCNLVLNAELHAMRNIALKLGTNYDAISISIDPAETPQLALDKKATYMDRFGSPQAAESWHFLTGAEEQIRAVAGSVGFRYAWDPLTQQWAHASGIMVLTPEGKVARYLYGITYPNQDLRLALVEASARRIGSPVDTLLLMCFHYDPTRGRYGFAILNTLRVAGSATALCLGAFVFMMVRRERNEGNRA